jgi:mono/diheme cytochrome c family protein
VRIDFHWPYLPDEVDPRPRNLRADRLRLASTANGIPSLKDLQRVIRRGMPGTAMPAYDELSDSELDLLARQVQGLQRAGMREKMGAVLGLAEEDEPYAENVDELVEYRLTPGDVVPVPVITKPDASTIARGREFYLQLGCHNCHGDDGRGNPELPVFDEDGKVARPRDLVREPFKGGQDPASVYLRLQIGMPGTAHPACSGLSQQQMVDLVHYCCSLSSEPKHILTNHDRHRYRTVAAYLAVWKDENSGQESEARGSEN